MAGMDNANTKQREAVANDEGEPMHHILRKGAHHLVEEVKVVHGICNATIALLAR